jgi:DnaD/phage-associated family protein
MAERRAIKSAIWDDAWFGRLTPTEMVIWIGLFSQRSDDQGRFQDDPALIRSNLFPYQDISIRDVAAALDKFDGHIIRYEKGERLAQLVRWWDNQPMQYATPSNFPPPDGWVDCYRTNYKSLYICFNWSGQADSPSGAALWAELSVLLRPSTWTSYLARLNYNPTPTPNPTPNPKKKEEEQRPLIFSLYEQNIGTLAGMMIDELKDAEKTYPAEWIPLAFKEAVDHNARSWKYVATILRSWKEKGAPTNGKNGNGAKPALTYTNADGQPCDQFGRTA